jgi:hypothetical protein
MPGGSESFGVNNIDLDCMRDKDIKIGIESMVYALDQLLLLQNQMIIISQEIMPPSFSYVVVIEAIYIIHSNIRTVRKPDENIQRAYLPANRQVILRAAKNLFFLPKVNWAAPLKLDKIKWE